ncbi:hypothetical protein C8E05_4980 [Rhodococcus wratislaviensis]|uniref:Uncharacterized protein n=3 Tax=Rhodococcus TaxID=1827 RepID=A0AB38FCT7_RHOWR|nr:MULTISPECIES: hypothetical protein [Rhodococcus]AII07862.1 hypothetical protein EP51_25775 [Rhodococcus opacus]REE75514.1 hypothetical protein C8E05_4980 [Rhodococcus wratislaviensis]GAF50101.1 hypothetical protein RW1_094_01410 [Rhodococcus wratislaviensis NBRC 100605]SPZ39450.1 Uncharacterised protein [Rhodococcus wratislaviensis]
MGDLLITVLLLGSFIGAALMIRYINTRTARSATARPATARQRTRVTAADEKFSRESRSARL